MHSSQIIRFRSLHYQRLPIIMMHRSIAIASISVLVLAATFNTSSAVDHSNDNKLGLRNFLDQKTDLVNVEDGATCNPSGNDPHNPDEQDCPSGQYCSLSPIGTCPDPAVEQQGACVPVSARCNRSWKPVCGCDGVTYPNPSCSKGVNIAQMTPCEEE